MSRNMIIYTISSSLSQKTAQCSKQSSINLKKKNSYNHKPMVDLTSTDQMNVVESLQTDDTK